MNLEKKLMNLKIRSQISDFSDFAEEFGFSRNAVTRNKNC